MRLLLVFVLVAVSLAACSGGPFGDTGPPAPIPVTVTGTAEGAPLISWTDTDATSVWVTDEDGRTVWGISAGGRSLPEGRYERVLIPSPIPYGAYAVATGAPEETPRTTTAPGRLEPSVRYTANVMHLGGGSGGFTGRRPIVRRGTATFTVASAVPVD